MNNIKKIPAIFLILLISVNASAQLVDILKTLGNVGVKIPTLDIFEEKNVTTSITDALPVAFWLQDLDEYRASVEPDVYNFMLTPGYYRYSLQSYCLQAGTYGPTTGDGYLMSPLKGKRATLVENIIKRSVAHPEIKQQDIQVLLWGIIYGNKFTDLAPSLQERVRPLLTALDIADLSMDIKTTVTKEILALLPDDVKKTLQFYNDFRSKLANPNLAYNDLVSVAMLQGVLPDDPYNKYVQKGLWSYIGNGFYAKSLPIGYQNTNYYIYKPKKADVLYDGKNRLTKIEKDGYSMEIKYNDNSTLQMASIRFKGMQSGQDCLLELPQSVSSTVYNSSISKANTALQDMSAYLKEKGAKKLDNTQKQTLLNEYVQLDELYSATKQLNLNGNQNWIKNVISICADHRNSVITTLAGEEVAGTGAQKADISKNLANPATNGKQRLAISERPSDPNKPIGNGGSEEEENTEEHANRPTFTYSGGDIAQDKVNDYETTYVFSTDYFNKPANVYNHDLAIMSLELAMAAFGLHNQTYTSGHKADNIKKLLSDMVFQDSISYGYDKDPTANSIAVTFARKSLSDKDVLLVIAVRGGEYQAEWGGNFNVGSGNVHEGFNIAKEKVLGYFSEYIFKNWEYVKDKNVKLWITGYSRGSAVANLLGVHFDDMSRKYNSYALGGGDKFNLKHDDIYTYCFATPNNSKNAKTAVEDSNYNNIFCIINPFDPVPRFPFKDWGFKKYGKILELPKPTAYNYNSLERKMLNSLNWLNNNKLKHNSFNEDSYFIDDFHTHKGNTGHYYTSRLLPVKIGIAINLIVDNAIYDLGRHDQGRGEETMDIYLDHLVDTTLLSVFGKQTDYFSTKQDSAIAGAIKPNKKKPDDVQGFMGAITGTLGIVESAKIGFNGKNNDDIATLGPSDVHLERLLKDNGNVSSLDKDDRFPAVYNFGEGSTDLNLNDGYDIIMKEKGLKTRKEAVKAGAQEAKYNSFAVTSGHYPELYLAWMKSISENDLTDISGGSITTQSLTSSQLIQTQTATVQQSLSIPKTTVVPTNNSVIQQLAACKTYKELRYVAKRNGVVSGEINKGSKGFANPSNCIIAVFTADRTLSALLDVGSGSRTDLLSGETIQNPEQYYPQGEYYLLYMQQKNN